MFNPVTITVCILGCFLVATYNAPAAVATGSPPIHYRYATVNVHRVFYRESGDASHPNVLLLHGFPTSSHMFRNLIPLLSPRYHVIAPDLPGFGFTESPPRSHFDYTFANLAKVIGQFADTVGFNRCAIYVHDYGAPVAWRLALAKPERIVAFISQNGNAYLEGFSDVWKPIQLYWKEPTVEHRNALRPVLLTISFTKWQYLNGVQDATLVAPETYYLDQSLMDRPGNDDIQLDLFKDYVNNVVLYPAVHRYFAQYQPPLLATWGKNDQIFLPQGAVAFKKDLPHAKVVLLDTGHFALETHAQEIAKLILQFLGKLKH